jgi:hypothetical protein
MRRTISVVVLIALVTFAVLGLVGAPAAVAAKPGITHLEFSATFTDPDFCGTGKTVVIDSSFRGTLFDDPNQRTIDEWLTLRGRDVFTNPENGETVVAHAAGAVQLLFPADPGRVIATEIGLRTQLVHHGPGGLLTRDAGYVVVDFTFSIVGGEIVLQRGPHPFLEALVEGEDRFCATITRSLGLS